MRILALLTFFIFSAFGLDISPEVEIGDVKIRIISLKTQKIDPKILIPNDKNDEKEIQKLTKNLPANKHNVALLQAKNLNILIDSGYENTIDILLDSLKSLNLSAGDITHIILTHAHKDHIGGLSNAKNKTFPNAKILIDNNEFAYWSDDLSDIFKLYEIDFFGENGKLFENISEIQAIPAYGHTPGHSIIRVSKDEKEFIFIGDVMHILGVQRKHPQISVKYDFNANIASQTRIDFRNKYRGTTALFSGTHIPSAFYVCPMAKKKALLDSKQKSPWLDLIYRSKTLDILENR